MEILVTGGTGGIGKKLIPALISSGHRISVLCRNRQKALEILPVGCRIIIGDVTDKNSILGCCEGVDIVYHLIGISGNDRPSASAFEKYKRINVDGTRNIVEEAQKSGVKRFIYISSIAAMGLVKTMPISENSECNPYLPYHVSKYEAEQVILKEFAEKDFPGIIIRPAQVYGVGGEYVYQNMIRLIKTGFFPKIGKKDALVSHCYIDDLITMLTLAVNKGNVGHVYICTTEQSIGFYESINLIAKLMNRKVIMLPIPKCIMLFIVSLIEKLFCIIGKIPPVTRSNIIAVTTDRVYDLSINKRDFGFIGNVTMKDGIERCVNYNKEQKLF